mmetsp:Transcript_45370/g.105277  ORF Transcript_45370/g.105277 Transcript_45370/m.105277 type:complete len:326 (+) Transcript_45370:70-1047(+)
MVLAPPGLESSLCAMPPPSWDEAVMSHSSSENCPTPSTEPDIPTEYMGFLSQCCDSSSIARLDLPMPLAKSMAAEAQRSIGPDAHAVPAVEALLLWMRACEKLKDATLADALYKYAVEHYGLPGEAWSLGSDLCDCLLGAFCKGGQPERAVSFFWHMFAVGLCPTSHGVCLVISAFLKTGAHVEAAVWFHVLRSHVSIPNMTAYNAIISGCAQVESSLDAALDYLTMMLEDGLEPTTITYNALIACAQRENPALLRGPFDAAAVLLRKIVERHMDPTIVLEIASSQAAQRPPKQTHRSVALPKHQPTLGKPSPGIGHKPRQVLML